MSFWSDANRKVLKQMATDREALDREDRDEATMTRNATLFREVTK